MLSALRWTERGIVAVGAAGNIVAVGAAGNLQAALLVTGGGKADQVYVAQTQPNAAAGRYFNPLPGLTFLGGVTFGY